MKKIMGIVAAVAMMMSGVAFAEGYLSANDLDKGTLTADKACEDGFVIKANGEKPVVVESCEKCTAPDGEEFTQILNMKGKKVPSQDARYIMFPAKKGEKISIYSRSSGEEVRPALLIDPEGNEIGKYDAPSKAGPCAKDTFTAPADGNYKVMATAGTVNFFMIKVEK